MLRGCLLQTIDVSLSAATLLKLKCDFRSNLSTLRVAGCSKMVSLSIKESYMLTELSLVGGDSLVKLVCMRSGVPRVTHMKVLCRRRYRGRQPEGAALCIIITVKGSCWVYVNDYTKVHPDGMK